MYSEFDEKMVINFLERNYPVTRVKHNTRFKRAITVDGGLTFFLSEKNSHNVLKNRLLDTLITVFCFEKNFIVKMINIFLP